MHKAASLHHSKGGATVGSRRHNREGRKECGHAACVGQCQPGQRVRAHTSLCTFMAISTTAKLTATLMARSAGLDDPSLALHIDSLSKHKNERPLLHHL